jgi:serine/threonine-protein kinase
MIEPAPLTPDDLLSDPLLRDAPVVEGFKVLDPAVIYARIGKGGMGAVYRGLHCKLNLDVAVKCLMPSLAAEDPGFIERFEREARIAASLTHQNVVRVMDVQNHRGLHYLVMEFVRGETVRERVVRKGPLAEAEALTILFGACSGLAEAHGRGIVHRDIKPDNLLISIEGRVKVADLGLARGTAPGESGGTLSSGGMGTPQYMPPEQWARSDVGPTADVWAMGAVLYFLLAGEHAIADGPLHTVARAIGEQEFPSLRQRRPELRPEVHALFERCVRRAPHERFADAEELLLALRTLGCADEASLRDPGGAARRDGVAMVTPPPRETILRIRAVLETEPEVTAPGHGLARPALTKPAHGPQVGPRVAHAAEAGDSAASAMPFAEVPTVKSPAVGQVPAAANRESPADDAAPTRAGAAVAVPAPQAEVPLPTPLPQGLEHAAQMAAARSSRTHAGRPAVDRPEVADHSVAPARGAVAPGRRWWWLLLLVLSVSGVGFTVWALLPDDRVHPVTEPLFRPMDQFETPPLNDPANGDRPRRDGGK